MTVDMLADCDDWQPIYTACASPSQGHRARRLRDVQAVDNRLKRTQRWVGLEKEEGSIFRARHTAGALPSLFFTPPCFSPSP
jgi:hypothetical protein